MAADGFLVCLGADREDRVIFGSVPGDGSEDTVDVEGEKAALENVDEVEQVATETVFEVVGTAGTSGTKDTRVLLPVKVGIPEVIRSVVILFKNVGVFEHDVAVGVVVVGLLLVLVLFDGLGGDSSPIAVPTTSITLEHTERCVFEQPLWIFL